MPGKVKNQAIDTKQWDTARMISIGHMAKTYGVLPSYIRDHATTFDVMITDVYATWESHQMNKSSGSPNLNDYDTDQLKEILERGRNG